MWKGLAEMGVLGLTIDSEYGGFGEGATSQLVVQRELGRGLVLEPVTPSSVMAAAVLGAYGSAAQKQDWLPAIAAGERIVTLAYRSRARATAPRRRAPAPAAAAAATCSTAPRAGGTARRPMPSC